MIDRDAKLTTANLRAALQCAGIEHEFKHGGLCSVYLDDRLQRSAWSLVLWRFLHGVRSLDIHVYLPQHLVGDWRSLGTISTIGELIDWYERLTGRKWPEQ